MLKQRTHQAVVYQRRLGILEQSDYNIIKSRHILANCSNMVIDPIVLSEAALKTR